MRDELKLNLGAGLRSRPGWINYDRSRVVLVAQNPVLRRLARLVGRTRLVSKTDVLDWPRDTYTVDLTKGIPGQPGSVDVIFSSHMLEHVWPEQAEFILSECHRVLKPGGIIRLAVPDLRKAAERYLAGDRDFFPDHGGRPMADAFVDSLHLRPQPKGRRLERALRRLLRTDEGGHRWMYDGESLSERLLKAGFTDVRIRDYQDSDHPEAGQLDSRQRDSVYVEARR